MLLKIKFDFWFCLILAGLIISCNSPYTPKKTGYFKIDFPRRAYQTFNEPGYPYSFEYPKYAKVERDTNYFDNDSFFWINIDFPQFNGMIYISYKEIGGVSHYKVRNKAGQYVDSVGENVFSKLVKDSYSLSFKNDVKAYSIEDSLMKTPEGLTGIYFSLTGDVATAHQFFLSDTTKHFLRGALYFDATPNEDSLSIVNNFLQTDLKHLINTLEWTSK